MESILAVQLNDAYFENVYKKTDFSMYVCYLTEFVAGRIFGAKYVEGVRRGTPMIHFVRKGIKCSAMYFAKQIPYWVIFYPYPVDKAKEIRFFSVEQMVKRINNASEYK